MIIKSHNGAIQLPDFMMVGAAKSGTTTIHDFLNRHPEIYFPNRTKEPHYFSFGGTPPSYLDEKFIDKLVWKTSDYLKLYEQAPSGLKLGDASTSYLYRASQVISNIQGLYGEESRKISIIIVLRNPIDRAYSHYNYLLRNGFEKLPFDVAIQQDVMTERKQQRWGFDYLGYGDYAEGVRLYQKHFDRVKVLLFEELNNAPETTRELCDFLEISRRVESAFPKTNPSGKPRNAWLAKTLLENRALKYAVNSLPKSAKRSLLVSRDSVLSKVLHKPEMSMEAHEQLRQRYKYPVIQLEGILDKNLSSWLQ